MRLHNPECEAWDKDSDWIVSGFVSAVRLFVAVSCHCVFALARFPLRICCGACLQILQEAKFCKRLGVTEGRSSLIGAPRRQEVDNREFGDRFTCMGKPNLELYSGPPQWTRHHRHYTIVITPSSLHHRHYTIVITPSSLHHRHYTTIREMSSESESDWASDSATNTDNESDCDSDGSLDLGPCKYWSGKGAHQADLDRLHEKYIPSNGPAFAFHGEILRRISNIQHQLLNNGSREQARLYTIPENKHRYNYEWGFHVKERETGDALPREWEGKVDTLPESVREVLHGHFDGIDLDDVIDAAVEYALECEKNDTGEIKEKSRKLQEEKAESERSWESYLEMETFMEPLKEMARCCDWEGLDRCLTEPVVEKIRTFTDRGGVKWVLISGLCKTTSSLEADVMETALLLRSKGLLDLASVEDWVSYDFCRLVKKFPTLLTLYPTYLVRQYDNLLHALRDERMLNVIVKNRIPLPARSLPILCQADNQLGMRYLRKILRYSWADMACDSSCEENVNQVLKLEGPLGHRRRVVKALIRNGVVTVHSWKRTRRSLAGCGREHDKTEDVVEDVIEEVVEKELRLETSFWEERWSRPGGVLFEQARSSFAGNAAAQTLLK
jgi:hypothetical protein